MDELFLLKSSVLLALEMALDRQGHDNSRVSVASLYFWLMRLCFQATNVKHSTPLSRR